MNNHKDVNQLIIFKNSEFAGTLQRTNQGCEFSLNPNFIQHSKAAYFSYCIPKNLPNTVTHGDNLPPFFAGLLPEGRRLNALISQIKNR